MATDNELDPLERWLNQQVQPLPPPSGTFELITKRARRRKIRKAVVMAVSAAAVAVAVAVAVPVGLSLHLTNPSSKGVNVADGGRPSSTGNQSPEGTGSQAANSATATGSASGSSTPSTGINSAGYLPPNYQPSSVTWDSTTTGWIIGPAGTPGQCANANPDICTSVARTDDGGATWHGLPAPDTGSPSGATGVSGIRFLDGVNGWAFGPELWATHDGGEHWTQVDTGGQRVTDLETVGNRAYALFARCTGTYKLSFGLDCTSYTLMTTVATSDQWTPVGGATNGLTAQGNLTSGMIALSGTTGYLVAPDGTLYSGPIGGAWQRAGTMPCQPGTPQASGLPRTAQIALSSSTSMVTYCAGPAPGSAPRVYTSADSGATWAQSTAALTGIAEGATLTSIAATSSGTVVLATSAGVYVLPQGATQWQASTVTGTQAPRNGFTYVGMTTSEQGVAVPADASLHEIFMTTDGGQTWQARPIQS